MFKTIYKFLRSYLLYRKNITFSQYLKYKMNSSKRKKKKSYISLKPKFLNKIFFCRAGSSDFAIFRDFFLKDDYVDINNINVKNIIDAGANIGAFSVLFKKKFPDSHIVAIEPDVDNCKLFKMNTKHLKNIKLIKGGVASVSGKKMKISNPDHAEYSYSLEYSNDGVPTYSINDIMLEKGWSELDVLKIDIEGGEIDVFSKNTEWLKVTKYIIIELHDYKAKGCSKALINAIKDHNYRISFSGENLILINEKIIA